MPDPSVDKDGGPRLDAQRLGPGGVRDAVRRTIDFIEQVRARDDQRVAAVLVEADHCGDATGEEREAPGDQAAVGAVRAHGGEQRRKQACRVGADIGHRHRIARDVEIELLRAPSIRGIDAGFAVGGRRTCRLELDPKQLNLGKRLLGTWGGDSVPDRDFPRYARLLDAGKLFREADPKLRTYTDPVPGLSWKDFERIEPLVDVWAPNMRLVSGLLSGDPRIQRIMNAGSVWSYECVGEVKSLSPLRYNRGNAWRAKFFGLSGIGF